MIEVKDEVWVLLAALVIDLLLGEPPASLHPVVWMGETINRLRKGAGKNRRTYGLLIVTACTVLFAGLSFLIVLICLKVKLLGILVSAFLLKSTFAVGSLSRTARSIYRSLTSGDTAGAKKKLPALVGRDPAPLSREEVTSAAIESVGENFVDAVVSPLFYFALGYLVGYRFGMGLALGVSGAIAYKVINTADSILGYREIEEGFFPAKSDDVANFLPARISLLFLLFASLFGGSPKQALLVWRNDRGATASINSGCPMSLVAGALGVRLVKPGNYVLGKDLPLPEPGEILRATRILWISSALLFLLVFLLLTFL